MVQEGKIVLFPFPNTDQTRGKYRGVARRNQSSVKPEIWADPPEVAAG